MREREGVDYVIIEGKGGGEEGREVGEREEKKGRRKAGR